MTILPQNRALVVFSGGQDSTTCLYWAHVMFQEVHAITFDYGQRHAIELEAARQIISMSAFVKTHEVISLPHGILESTSPLVSDADLEQYASPDMLPGGIEKTFIPMRNQLFLTIAANRAVARGALNIITGVSQADYGGYPDCEEEFIRILEHATNRGTYGKGGTEPGRLQIVTPLINKSKAATVRMAVGLHGCMDAMAFSHTAYDGMYPPTGRDHASLLRAQGFAEAGVPDPLVVRAWQEGLMELPDTSNYAGLRSQV